MIEARNRKPFVQWNRFANAVIGRTSRAKFDGRRMNLGASQDTVRAVAFHATFEFESELLREEDLFQSNAVMHERSDVQSSAAAGIQSPDTDHFLLGVHNAWDIVCRIQGAASA